MFYGLPALLDAIDLDVVRDVTVCSVFEGFPGDLAEKIHWMVLRYSAASQPVNAKSPPDYQTPNEHVRGIGDMLSELHTIFHEVVTREIDGFSDDPRFPLRLLYARGEEVPK